MAAGTSKRSKSGRRRSRKDSSRKTSTELFRGSREPGHTRSRTSPESSKGDNNYENVQTLDLSTHGLKLTAESFIRPVDSDSFCNTC